MKNPATTIEHDELNEFTLALKQLIQYNAGSYPVTLRDGRTVDVEYYDEDECEGFRHVNNADHIYLAWFLCGRSVTGRIFDMISIDWD